MPLTDTAARQAKFTGKQQKLSDEKGLYLLINSAGKYWRLKYRIAGKEKLLSLGVYPEVSLKEARAKRDEARKMIAEGSDPALTKRQEKAAKLMAAENSFAAIAKEWHKAKVPTWSERHGVRVIESFERDIFPELGPFPITDITAPMILAAIRKIEARGAPIEAKRTLQRVGAVIDYAIDTGRATLNPARGRRDAVIAPPTKHRPALPRADLPQFLRKLADDQTTAPANKIALRLLMLTMTRPGEIRAARWAEFDFDRAEWRIPAERMKMRTEHIIPLSRQVLALLNELRLYTGSGSLLFPSERRITDPMSNMTMNKIILRLGYQDKATPHGMRSLASTVMNEEGFDPDVIERQLAHAERNQVRAAYHRAEYLDDRRKLLQWWADYLEAQEGGNVLPVNFNRVTA